ncbi:MAG: efflux transporter outer membrane subunit [Methylohalobius sp. ZOD2]
MRNRKIYSSPRNIAGSARRDSGKCPVLPAWLFPLALLAGCAFLPDADESEAHFLSQPDMALTLDTTDDAAPVDGKWPHRAWWRQFGSDELDRLIETALKDNPDLKTAAHRLRQSQAQITVETARLLPGLESSTQFGHARFSANSVQAKLAGESFGFILFNPVNLRWHLDLWGKDRAAIAAAMGRSKARAAELADARLWLSSAIARAYLRLVVAEQRLAAAEELTRHQNGRLEVSRVRWRAGLDPHMRQDTAVERYLDAQALKDGLRQEVALLRHEIAYLAGRGPDFGDTIQIQPVRVSKRFSLPTDLPLHLLGHRPDVAVAKHLAEAAAQEVKVARTAFYPDVNLVGFAGLHSVSFSDILLPGSSLAYQIGPTVDFPLFQGGRLRGNLQASRAAYAAAVETYNEAVLHAVRNVADALTRWQESNRRLTSHQAALNAARHRYRLAAGLHEAGLNDRSELLAAATETSFRELERARLEMQRNRAVVDLIQALGGGWTKTDIPDE